MITRYINVVRFFWQLTCFHSMTEHMNVELHVVLVPALCNQTVKCAYIKHALYLYIQQQSCFFTAAFSLHIVARISLDRIPNHALSPRTYARWIIGRWHNYKYTIKGHFGTAFFLRFAMASKITVRPVTRLLFWHHRSPNYGNIL